MTIRSLRRLLPMPAPWRPRTVIRVTMLSLAAGLAAFSIWIVFPELVRGSVRQLPANAEAAAVAAKDRARADLAAKVGGIRGDLWTDAAFTYATLLQSGPAGDAAQRATANEARATVERALTHAPHESAAWLFAAGLGFHFDWPDTNPTAALKMSYYTSPNDIYLVPLRLFTATHSNALADDDMQQLVRRDVRMILTRWPHLRPALVAGYRDAESAAKRLLESAVAEIEPAFLPTMRMSASP
jgi:hypothetical protein